MRVTGVMVQYFVACLRELWFFGHNISLNDFDENVLVGRRIHEESYGRLRRSVLVDGCIALDVVDSREGLTVFEVKKSSRLTEPARMQTYYYLWYLKHKKGVEAKAVLKYPAEKREEFLELTPEIEFRIERIVEEIPKVLSLPKPPKAVRKPYCRRCSYFEFCSV